MQIKHIPVRTANILPKGLLQYVDRGTLELCLHLIVLSLSLVSEKVYHDFIYIEYSTLDTDAAVFTHFTKSYYFYMSHIVVVLINSFLHLCVLIFCHFPLLR
jgi:hypothetical protein